MRAKFLSLLCRFYKSLIYTSIGYCVCLLCAANLHFNICWLEHPIVCTASICMYNVVSFSVLLFASKVLLFYMVL